MFLPVLAWEIGSHAVGENATPHENERVRKVLVQKDPNTRIGMGDERRKFIQFKLEWHQDRTQTAKALKNYKAPKMKYLTAVGGKLGSGHFGTVQYTKPSTRSQGDFMAVKIQRLTYKSIKAKEGGGCH